MIATVTQICDIYWDLVNAYDTEQVGERSVAFATETLDTVPQATRICRPFPRWMCSRLKAKWPRASRILTVARTNLELQELYMKNAITRSLDDPVLEEMPVVPTDHHRRPDQARYRANSGYDCIAALKNRTELQESSLDLNNRELSRKTARNALLPQLTLYGFYAGTGVRRHSES